MMLKQEIRLNFTAQRKRYSHKEVQASSFAIAQMVSKLPIWSFDNYHIYLTIEEKKEVITQPIIDLLRKLHKNIAVPKVTGEQQLSHHLLTEESELVLNKWGIPEPVGGHEIDAALIDVVFVPLLAFDLKGHRVGYGKGFYDRFLAGCKPEVIKVGLSFFEAVDEISDTGREDVPLNYCVTPHKVYSF